MFRSIHCSLASLILFGAIPAFAAAPQSEQLVDVDLGALPSIIDCDGFSLSYEMSDERARITTYFDQNGNPTRMRVRWIIHGTLIHSGTGLTLRDQAAITTTTDLSSNTETITGVGFHYAVPGEGLIFLEVGRLVLGPNGNIQFQAGRHDGPFGFDQLCLALAT